VAVTRAQKLRLGVFLAVGLTALVGGLIVLAGMKLGETRDEYVVRYTEGQVSLSGLEVGSPVKYSGIRVGRVEAIRIDPDDVSVIQVKLSLDEGTPVAEDSRANLGSMGITGLKYIELSRGSAKARVREAGEEIPPGTSFMDDLTTQAGAIAKKASTVLDRVAAFTAPEMKDRVASILEHTDELLENVNATVSENREQLKTLGANLSTTAERLARLTEELTGTAERVNRLLDESRPHLTRVLDESAGLVAEARQTRARLDRVLAEAEGLLQEGRTVLGPEHLQQTLLSVNRLIDRGQLLLVQSRENIVEAVGYLRDTAENMAQLSRRLREDPSLLLLGESDGGDFE